MAFRPEKFSGRSRNWPLAPDPGLDPGSRSRTQRDRVVDFKFKPRSDHQLDFFQVVPGSIPQLRWYLANSSTFC